MAFRSTLETAFLLWNLRQLRQKPWDGRPACVDPRNRFAAWVDRLEVSVVLATVSAQLPDFQPTDENLNSDLLGDSFSPRDYLLLVSG